MVLKLIQANKENECVERCVAQSIEAYEEVKSKINDLEAATTKSSDFIHDYFKSLKSRITLKREECDLMVEKIFSKMISDLHVFETECQNALELAKPVQKLVDIVYLKEKTNEIKRKIHFLNNTKNKNEIEVLNSDIEKLKQIVDTLLNDIKDKLLLGMEFKFEPKQLSIQSNMFGLFKMVKLF
jgi:hypothetical protein